MADGLTDHPDQPAVRRAAAKLNEYWRRSGGTLAAASPRAVTAVIRQQLARVASIEDFRRTGVTLDLPAAVPDARRAELDAFPTSAAVFGDRVPLRYDIEGGQGVVRLRLREKQARRIRERDLPDVERPIRFSVFRGKREVVRAASLDELHRSLAELPRRDRGRRNRRRQR